jgi:hypothetical protein
MRKFLFYALCVGGVTAFAYGVKFVVHKMNPDMAIGTLIGFAIFLFAITSGRRWLMSALGVKRTVFP